MGWRTYTRLLTRESISRFYRKRRTLINVAPGEDVLAENVGKHIFTTREPLAPTPGGDASFSGFDDVGKPIKVGVERKSVANLLSSQSSGELADQLRRMLDNYDVVILLISGPLSKKGRDRHVVTTPRAFHKVSFDSLWNELGRWESRGVQLQLCDTGDEGMRVVSLYRMFQRPDTSTERPRLKKSKSAPLTTTPGLGPRKMENLLRGLVELEGAEAIVKSALGPKLASVFWKKVKQLGTKVWRYTC